MAKEVRVPGPGANTRAAKKAAVKLGCEYKIKPGTGDGYIWHPELGYKDGVLFSDHRKDAPRNLTAWVQKLPERLEERRRQSER